MSSASIAEIKAVCSHPDKIEDLLTANGASFLGKDHQIDTYFKVAEGRLKLRQGQVENTLIFYNRKESIGIKNSQVKFLKLEADQVQSMKDVLMAVHPVLVVVDKIRKIFFMDNVKFHIDQVNGLGSFVEIEAIGNQSQAFDQLVEQCDKYRKLFDIKNEDCIAASYSDLILEKDNA